MSQLSDTEIVCGWMEPRPNAAGGMSVASRWWKVRTVATGTGERGGFHLCDVAPVLDVCADEQKFSLVHNAEECLSDRQWIWYAAELCRVIGNTGSMTRQLIHASPESRITALARVISASSTPAQEAL